MRRPPAFPPSVPRQRPKEVEAELERLLPPATPLEHLPAEPVPPRTGGAVSTRLRERLEELKGARRRARKKQVALVGGSIALAAALAWVVGFSPLLALEADDIEITGTSPYVSTGDVRAVVGEFEGVPLARLDLAGIRDALTNDTAVKDAQVARHWPNGLTVALEARTPVAATPTEAGFSILDGDGVKLAESAEQVEGLPLVEVDQGADALADAIAAVLEVMDSLPSEILEQVQTVGAKNPDEVEFTLAEGARVVWGSAEDSELKASVLAVLLEVPAEVYNVASPLSPITS